MESLSSYIRNQSDDLVAEWKSSIVDSSEEPSPKALAEISSTINWIANYLDDPSGESERLQLRTGLTLSELNSWIVSIHTLRDTILRDWLLQRQSFSLLEVASISSLNRAVDQCLIQGLDAFRLSQANIKAVFTTVLSHDLMNGLSAILTGAGYLDMVLKPDSPEYVTAGRISQSGKKVVQLVRDLDDFIEHQDGTLLDLDPIPLELNSLCRDAIEAVAKVNEKYRFKISTGSEIRGHWDFVRINQLLRNLLVNAVQFGTSEKLIEVSVDQVENNAVVSIHNWGDPILPEKMRFLFRPPERKALMSAKGIRGPKVGLGLYVCYLVARSHGGTLTVKSSVAEGTTFTLELPIESNF